MKVELMFSQSGTDRNLRAPLNHLKTRFSLHHKVGLESFLFIRAPRCIISSITGVVDWSNTLIALYKAGYMVMYGKKLWCFGRARVLMSSRDK